MIPVFRARMVLMARTVVPVTLALPVNPVEMVLMAHLVCPASMDVTVFLVLMANPDFPEPKGIRETKVTRATKAFKVCRVCQGCTAGRLCSPWCRTVPGACSR